jgi:cyclopropane-fatty-acyl-phospholipid synthase
MGLRALYNGVVKFTNVVVPRENIIWGEGKGLRVVDTFSFGLDYARTLAVWRSNFLAQLPAVRAQGYSESFIRMWEFYLAYCEAGFDSGDTNVMHFTLEKM